MTEYVDVGAFLMEWWASGLILHAALHFVFYPTRMKGYVEWFDGRLR